MAASLQIITWFPARDFTTDVPGFQIFTQAGLVHLDGVPKPAYTAYRTFLQEVGDAPFVRKLAGADSGAPDAQVYEFARPDARLWIAWTDAAPTSLPLLTPAARARDLYGHPLTGTPRVPLGAEPIYIEIR